MGKATKWFRGLFGLRRSSDSAPPPSTAAPKPHKDKRRWSFVNSYRENKNLHQHRHQARRALRALKGLVKLQALVRGHIERKRTAQWLKRMQTLLRAQARARACRAQILQAPHFHVPATPEKFETPVRSSSMEYNHSPSVLKRNGSRSHVTIGNRDIERSWTQRRSWTRTCSMDDERSAGIFEIDSGKAHKNSKRGNLFDSTSQPLVSDHYRQSFAATRDSTSHQSGHSPYSCEVEENSVCDAVNFTYTPTKSDGSNRSYLSSGCCEYYPSYMAYTESSKAKVRSLSAPKQRLQYERCGSFNRFSQTQRVSSTMRASFTSKAYPGSGHLDNLGLPLGYRY
ncbi:uncharacterized protein LOC107642959 isoform X2 [Arachis ipaensis]|uniref:uncharacterized protein LOC107642959 isoform X2 n=1 Tax=Arachis ipaensis TaxID=130454 RepID=UPI000A2B751C|nr:uncharacterized protein LOC107642959 isoform X2 [Arachis ipaensis]